MFQNCNLFQLPLMFLATIYPLFSIILTIVMPLLRIFFLIFSNFLIDFFFLKFSDRIFFLEFSDRIFFLKFSDRFFFSQIFWSNFFSQIFSDSFAMLSHYSAVPRYNNEYTNLTFFEYYIHSCVLWTAKSIALVVISLSCAVLRR